MAFGWLGTFRSGSWLTFREFVLNERRDASRRIAVIEAELARIGEVTVYYGTTTDAEGNVTVTEERTGFAVSEGSSLEKLIRAYTALGGNPFDISLFLTPTSTLLVDGTGEQAPSQPYDGVVYPVSDSYVSGHIYEGGFQVIKKYVPRRVGGRKELDDARTAALVAQARGWTNKAIKSKRNDLEARIIKLCDLKEQLEHELEDLTMALSGTISAIPSLDDEEFNQDHTIAAIVAAIDTTFYEVDTDGVTPKLGVYGTKRDDHLNLLKDIENEEDNTAL